MSLLFLGMTLSVIGKGMLALGIIWVHITMATERSIDDLVVRSFKTEMYITILGFTLIALGYVLEVHALGGFSELMFCKSTECAALVGAATN